MYHNTISMLRMILIENITPLSIMHIIIIQP